MLIGSLKCHDNDIVKYEPKKMSKSLALNSQGKMTNSKALQTTKDLDESELDNNSEDSDDEELSFISRNI